MGGSTYKLSLHDPRAYRPLLSTAVCQHARAGSVHIQREVRLAGALERCCCAVHISMAPTSSQVLTLPLSSPIHRACQRTCASPPRLMCPRRGCSGCPRSRSRRMRRWPRPSGAPPPPGLRCPPEWQGCASEWHPHNPQPPPQCPVASRSWSCSRTRWHSRTGSAASRAAALGCCTGCPQQAAAAAMMPGRMRLCMLLARLLWPCRLRLAAASATCRAMHGRCGRWPSAPKAAGSHLERRGRGPPSGCGTSARGAAWPLCLVSAGCAGKGRP